MVERIISIMSTVLETDESEINIDSSMKNVDSWDSLKHINLIICLEKELGLEFTNDEIVQMISLKKITSIIDAK